MGLTAISWPPHPFLVAAVWLVLIGGTVFAVTQIAILERWEYQIGGLLGIVVIGSVRWIYRRRSNLEGPMTPAVPSPGEKA
jgi:hypothetical protein